MLKMFRLISFLLLAVLMLGLVRADMTFYAVAVGQGDSCIIQCPNRKDIVVLDMGATVPQYVKQPYITYLLKERFQAASSGKSIHIVVSHSHIDHYSYIPKAIDSELLPNLKEVILGGSYNGYGKSMHEWLESSVKNVYTINNENKCFGNSQCTPTSTNLRTRYAATNFSRKFENATISQKYVGVSDPWQFCGSDVQFTVLGANIGSTPNGKSVILKVKYNSWSIVMSGDFEMIGPQQELMEKWPASTLKSNYYKVAHHGAWTAKKPNIPALLNAIQPQKVYISQGYPSLSKFHHPNSTTITNLLALNSIVKIDPNTNKPFVYWDSSKEEVVVMKSGMNRAIYETCRIFNSGNQTQVCQDVWIRTDGRQDETLYMDVPKEYVND